MQQCLCQNSVVQKFTCYTFWNLYPPPSTELVSETLYPYQVHFRIDELPETYLRVICKSRRQMFVIRK